MQRVPSYWFYGKGGMHKIVDGKFQAMYSEEDILLFSDHNLSRKAQLPDLFQSKVPKEEPLCYEYFLCILPLHT